MTVYELSQYYDEKLISMETVSEAEKRETAETFFSAVSDRKTVIRFHNGVNAPRAENGDTRGMYPEFYIPPYNGGKKHKIITGATPKTHILSANAYELEIIRLLNLFSPEDPRTVKMTQRTLARLETTCFDTTCYVGECYEAGLVSLRFRAAVCPQTAKLTALAEKAAAHIDDAKRHSGVRYYLWLALSELPGDMADYYLAGFREELQKKRGSSRATTLNNIITERALSAGAGHEDARGAAPYPASL